MRILHRPRTAAMVASVESAQDPERLPNPVFRNQRRFRPLCLPGWSRNPGKAAAMQADPIPRSAEERCPPPGVPDGAESVPQRPRWLAGLSQVRPEGDAAG